MREFIYTPPKNKDLDIIYLDDDIIVLNKTAGLLSVAGKGKELSDCLEARVKVKFRKATIVHRLDCDTSGLIVMAMHIDAHRNLSRQFEMREVKKTYIAEVVGKVEKKTGEINAPIRCDIENRPKQIIDFENGRSAITKWQVIEYKDKTTILELTPITGRTHQLRLHMQYIGHAIIGDRIYADDKIFNMAKRLHLHAEKLEFTQPITKQEISLTSKCEFYLRK